MQDVLQRAGSRWSAPPIPVPQTTSSSPSSVTQSVTQDSITIQSHGTHVLTDPVGDTFGTVASFCADSFPPTAPPPGDCVNVVHPVMPDLTGMEMVLQSDQTLRITMTFKDPVVAWFSSTSPNLVLGFIDLDVDQNPATGIFPLTDGNNRSGSGATGMGTDYFISLFNFGYSDREGLAFVYKADISELTVIPTLFDGNQILMAVPLTLMGNDDGQVDFAAVVGTLAEPTDVIPNDGHGTLKKPAETIADLMALLNTCEAELKNAGMFEFLMNMLAAAEKFRAQGDLDKAIKKIEDFIKKLDPFAPSPAAVSLAQGSGGATPLSLSECAEKLIANAQNVLTNLEQEKKDRVKVVPNNPVPLPNKTYDPDNPASKDSFPEDIQKGLKKFKAVTFPFYSAMPKVTHSSGVEAKGNKFVAKGSAVTVQVPLSLTIQKYLPDNANDVLIAHEEGHAAISRTIYSQLGDLIVRNEVDRNPSFFSEKTAEGKTEEEAKNNLKEEFKKAADGLAHEVIRKFLDIDDSATKTYEAAVEYGAIGSAEDQATEAEAAAKKAVEEFKAKLEKKK